MSESVGVGQKAATEMGGRTRWATGRDAGMVRARPKPPALLAAVALVSGLVLLAASAGTAVAGVTERVSVGAGGAQANGVSSFPVISADGRYVAFASGATNLVASDGNGVSDIFVRDRVAGTTERVSMASDGTPANGSSTASAMNADGRYIAFVSAATNLVVGGTNGRPNVFVRDRVTGTTELVSVASDVTCLSASLAGVSVSADGRFVMFGALTDIHSASCALPVGHYVFVRDRSTRTTELISVAPDGTAANGDSLAGSMSPDGRYVAFSSAATNLVPGGGGGVFVRDRVTRTTELVGLGGSPALSADGRYVAFFSTAANLVPGDTNMEPDIFVRDRATGTTARVSVASKGTQANNFSFAPSISADGRYVAFFSVATNLVAGDTNNRGDVFVHDLATGETERVSIASDGTQANGDSCASLNSCNPVTAISADGRVVAFESLATNLVPGDSNGVGDVFVRDRQINLSAPRLSISDRSVIEGAKGKFSTALFTVSLSPASTVPVAVNYSTADVTARANVDYLATFGTLTFSPGETAKTIAVTVIGDNLVERNETFLVNLDIPFNAVIADGQGVGTIVNDDLLFGTFALTPADATVAVHERLTYTLTWTVTPPLNWHDLQTVQLRISDDEGTILWVSFKEADGTLRLLNEAGHEVGPAFRPGHKGPLETSAATLYLRDSRVQGSGPTGPSVILTLDLSFKPRAAGRTYLVEVLATDDAGTEQIESAGTLTVAR